MYKIVIDPGHGGQDSGAVGSSGLYEKDAVLPVALELAQILRQAGAEVKLTRESDTVPWNSQNDLSERVRIANQWGADAFVSIHANATTSPSAKGMEVWTSVGQTAGDALAEDIANALKATFPGLVFRADMSDGDLDKESNFYVLYYTRMPAALVELAFITNPNEEALLRNPSYQAQAAEAIAKGLAAYLGLQLKAQTDPVGEAVKILQAAGIIASPDYWLENARPGRQANGQYVGLLLQKAAQKIRIT